MRKIANRETPENRVGFSVPTAEPTQHWRLRMPQTSKLLRPGAHRGVETQNALACLRAGACGGHSANWLFERRAVDVWPTTPHSLTFALNDEVITVLV